jgi:hypothetical protein
MENTQSDNTRDIAVQIFSSEPMDSCAIQLQLEETCAQQAQTKEEIDDLIFDILVTITFHGIEMLYNHRDITKLSKTEFELVQTYTKSYGYMITSQVKDNKLLIGFEKVTL